jgi:hypothetical protein
VKATLLCALLFVSVLSPVNVAPTQAASLVITRTMARIWVGITGAIIAGANITTGIAS